VIGSGVSGGADIEIILIGVVGVVGGATTGNGAGVYVGVVVCAGADGCCDGAGVGAAGVDAGGSGIVQGKSEDSDGIVGVIVGGAAGVAEEVGSRTDKSPGDPGDVKSGKLGCTSGSR